MRFWAWTHFEHTKCSVSPHGQEVDLSPYLEGEKVEEIVVMANVYHLTVWNEMVVDRLKDI